MAGIRLLVAALTIALAAGSAAATGEHGETYPVPRAKIARRVLRDARGALTIYSVGGVGGPLPTHVLCLDGSFTPGDPVLLDDTVPVSRRGQRTGVRALRYPVVALYRGYLRIVVDPVEDTRVWVSPDELRRERSIWFVPFRGELPQDMESMRLDLFGLSRSGTVRLYDDPRPDAACRTLRRGDFAFPARVKGQRRGYVKVSLVDRDGGYHIGWISTQGRDGTLAVWVTEDGDRR